MPPTFLANSVLISHFAFVFFVLSGGFFIPSWSWLIWLHLPSVLWTSSVTIFNWKCPLTIIEDKHRTSSGDKGYGRGFVEQYFSPYIPWADTARKREITAGLFVFVWNSLIYLFVVV